MEAKEYLHTILSGLVEHKDALAIEHGIDEMGVLLSVKVAPSDMGKIIGKEGQTAKSVRHIMNSYGYGQRQKISVKILEPV